MVYLVGWLVYSRAVDRTRIQHFKSSPSGCRALMIKNWRKKISRKLVYLAIYNKDKPSALQREHPALQKIKIINFFLCLSVIFALLDPDPGTPLKSDPIRIRIQIHIRILSTGLKEPSGQTRSAWEKYNCKGHQPLCLKIVFISNFRKGFNCDKPINTTILRI